jgi:diaminohydroxyphosphoribosylaminopyrimidine deaminase / 5-amino-6-(5-phosphoribosylamino)uracil reductase
MRRALALAARGHGQVAPNPKVGAVLVRDGVLVGEGWHATFGGPHAEVMALRAAGDRARGATAYVSLEPCHHHGKTPPCTEALVAAGVAEVVYAVADPNPVAAGGDAYLRAAGMAVVAGVLEDEARVLNAPFLFAARGAPRPFVTLKLALSIDGGLVDASRQRGWLTGPEAQQAVHALRAEADAVGVGIGTALADDPALTVRLAPAPRVPPLRVVFDRQGRLPLDSRLVRTARDVPVLVVVAPGGDGRARRALESRGVIVVEADTFEHALRTLRGRGVRHLLLEGGAGLASAAMAAGVVDHLITLQAPVILGRDLLPPFGALAPRSAASAPRLRVLARRALGADLMTHYDVAGG